MGQTCCTDARPAVALDALPVKKKSQFSFELGPTASEVRCPTVSDPMWYVAEGLSGTSFVRLPGSINDQRVTVRSCTDSVVAILDQSDSVQVDECTGCTIYVAPSAGSVFIRNCRDCTFFVICGQLRLRDCKGCQLSVACRSRPVIEASTSLRFCCFAGPTYADARRQGNAARLSVFINRWRLVHDFTPSREPNYKIEDGIPGFASTASERLRVAISDAVSAEDLDLLRFDVTGSTYPLFRKNSDVGEKHFFMFLSSTYSAVLAFLSTCIVLDTSEATTTDPFIAPVVDSITGDRPATGTAVICVLVSGEIRKDLEPPSLLHLTGAEIDAGITAIFTDAASHAGVFGCTF